MKAGMRSLTAAGALALSVAGCSMGTDAAKSTTSAAASTTQSSANSPSASSSSSSASSEASSSSSTSSSSEAPPVPADSQLVKATLTELAFAAPKSWVAFDQDRAKDPAVKKGLEPLAKKNGMSAEKMMANFTGTVDVVVMDASGTKSFNDNINVLRMTRPSLPTKEQYTKEVESAKAKPGEFTRISTPAGEGVQMPYSAVLGGRTVYGVSMVLPNGADTYSTLTVSAGDAASAAKYAKGVAASARKL